MRIVPALLVVQMAFACPAIASGYSTGFDTGYDYDRDLAGQAGWTIDDPAPDLSFFVDVNQSNAGALGGYYTAPTGQRVKLSHPVAIPLAGASFRVDMVMFKSTAYPGRDAAGWGLISPSGENLFTIGFEPAANNPDLLNITWSAGTRTPVVTGWAIFYDAPYTLDVTFVEGSGTPDIGFAATVTGANSSSFSGVLPGLPGRTWDSLQAQFVVRGSEAGDNFMAFDNLAAVPAPGVDADGDGYTAAMEEWFGTSDTNAGSSPGPVLSLSATTASLTFPSISGRDYLVDSSDDLQTWATTTVTATAATTHWLDPAGPAPRHRFFRIRKP